MPTYQWYAKNFQGYFKESGEAVNNANMIYQVLAGRGWTLNAVSALLGNMEYESGYNPWRWENDIIRQPSNTERKGYGLTQFTPSGKYILDPRAQILTGFNPNYYGHNGDPSDGNAQMLFVDQYADYYPTTAYPMTYAQFKASTDTPEYLAAVWLYNYERPADPNPYQRGQIARYWYDFLSNEPPPPEPPTPTTLTDWMKAVLASRQYIKRKDDDDTSKRKRTLFL